MPGDPNQEYWSDLRNGNPDALAGLYREHYVGLMNFGMKLTGDHDLTRDSITQMLLNLHRQHRKLPDVRNVRSYLLTSLRNEIVGALRRKRRTITPGDAHLPETINEISYQEYLEGVQTQIEQKQKVAKALEELTDREKELLCKRYFEDLSYDEIAVECGITKRTAYNIVNNALSRLKTILVQQARNKYLYFSLVQLISAGLA